MEYKIFRREKARDFTYKTQDKTYAIISITDMGSSNVNFNTKNKEIFSILRLQFEDVDTETGISRDDAKLIAKFVNNVKNNVDMIIVNCEAGISRSAGVCAGISKYLDDDDMWVFNDWKYYPNKRCYRYVLDAFEIDDPNWIDKILLNRKLENPNEK